MRTLTLTRRKSFIGSLGRYFIYIKDPQGRIHLRNCLYKTRRAEKRRDRFL